MSEVQIRTCREADLTRVQQLVDELYHAHPGRGAFAPDIRRPFTEFQQRGEKGRIVVFEHHDQVIGYAILVFFFSNEFGGNVIDIDELVVDHRNRGTGIGSGFFKWLESEYPQCMAFSLQVAPDNPSAQKLYERTGFKLSGNNHMFKLVCRSTS